MSRKMNKKEQEQAKKRNKHKSEGLIKTILSEDTVVEDPEYIIEKDPDEERRNAFKKAYEVILALVPETIKKKNKKKSKEKEEFDRNLSVRQLEKNSLERHEEEKEKEIGDREDKGFERGE